VLTAQSAVQVDEVKILVEGKPHTETSTQKLEQPTAPKPAAEKPAPKKSTADVATIRQAQERLVELKYLPADAVTGKADYRTQQAVMAFQAWEGLSRDGDVGPQTTAALKTASAPVPKDEGKSGRSTQIYRSKGVVLLVEDGKLVRAVHTSTGGPGHTTPAGSYKIYSKERNHMSRQYNVNLPYCQFFHAGYAFHEYPNVPAQPASHGCARLPAPEAPEVWNFTKVGTPVTVY
jgi:lipoprotein-anchoring transpeptidase ErfK/SrfK